MKRILAGIIAVCIVIGLVSRGHTGHSVIGRIAADHLTDKAKAGVTALLGGERLADVASWADENKDRSTTSWHFINVETGLSFDEIKKR